MFTLKTASPEGWAGALRLFVKRAVTLSPSHSVQKRSQRKGRCCGPHTVCLGEASLIPSPQGPFERRIAPGLFGFLSEAVTVVLTVTLLLCKIEDISEYYCDGKSV